MAAIAAPQLLRAGLLDGLTVLLASAPAAADDRSAPAGAVRAALADLGARVALCEPLGEDGRTRAEEELEAVVLAAGGGELLVVDGGSLFDEAHARTAAEGEEPGRVALRECLQASWNVTRALVGPLLAREGAGARRARLLYLAPAPDAGEHAGAARAGLENLARTLSVEWARHAITAVTLAPGGDTRASELAALVAYLASPAGAYFSGCVLTLGALGR